MKTIQTIPPRVAVASFLIATAFGTTPPPPKVPINPPVRPATQLGDPLLNLDDTQTAAFNSGLAEFLNVETIASGLGPIYNNTSCAACHSQPVTGGGSNFFVTRFGKLTNGQFDPLENLGGSLLQQFAIDPAAQEVIPPEANVVAHRQTTPLFGLGLVEAIPDAAIQQAAQRAKPDGIKGHAASIIDVVSNTTRIGRFGWKAQQATLLAFAGDAYRNEMGITNRFFPTENAPNGNLALLAQFDQFSDPEDVPDPNTGRSDIDTAADFIRYLAPPAPLPLTKDTTAGQTVFTQVGCAVCHQPSYFTGPNAVPVFANQTVTLYSDLLLHDMGDLGDNIAQGAASPREMKTAPLWGLRVRGPFLHDGRAATVDDAIRAHSGEASVVRDKYTKLTPAKRQELLDFLNSL